MKLGLVCILLLTSFLLLSRPLFYVVIAKSLTLSVKFALRRSVGLLVVILDALLDEAVASLEAGLISPPVQAPTHIEQGPQYVVQPIGTLTLLMTGLCSMLGNRMQRAPVLHRTPVTRLRAV